MTQGTLRQQLLFPRSRAAPANDDAMLHALNTVNLVDLVSRVGGLDVQFEQWQDVLSVGEQQRLAFARVLLLRPPLVCLDEATSALDAANERCVYEAMGERVHTWVSVGHREALLEHHTHVLEYAPSEPSKWRFMSIQAYRRAKRAANTRN
jgi:putative ATP-binding cassette transporter